MHRTALASKLTSLQLLLHYSAVKVPLSWSASWVLAGCNLLHYLAQFPSWEPEWIALAAAFTLRWSDSGNRIWSSVEIFLFWASSRRCRKTELNCCSEVCTKSGRLGRDSGWVQRLTVAKQYIKLRKEEVGMALMHRSQQLVHFQESWTLNVKLAKQARAGSDLQVAGQPLPAGPLHSFRLPVKPSLLRHPPPAPP